MIDCASARREMERKGVTKKATEGKMIAEDDTGEWPGGERFERTTEEWFESTYGSAPDCLSRLEAEVARLYDAGLDTPDRILAALAAPCRPDSKTTLLEALKAPDKLVGA